MKKIFIIISIIFGVIVSLLFLSNVYISQKTHHSFSYFPKIIIESIRQKEVSSTINIMILGVDRRDDWLEKTETTDTIIFSQVDFSQNKLKLFSFPRDLWDYFTDTKINQIYPLSLKKDSNNEKFSYISSNFSSISGQPINRILVLSTENLKQLADILGGVDLLLQNGFKDDKYPNDVYILDPKSDAPIYKTVEFKTGWVHLDSSNITEFVRSRKSSETAVNGGTDLGRIERQQQLINALIDKLKISLEKNPKLVFNLYNYWSNLEHNFSDTEIFAYFFKYGINLKNISIIRYPVSSGEDIKKDLLYHPKKFINSQWVFIPREKDYQSFQQYISNSLVSL